MFSFAGRQVRRAGDEDDRERVRDRPEHERDVPEEVALREVDVPLDDPEQADELVARLYSELAHREHLPVLVVLVLALVLELAPGGGEERLLERLDAEAPLHVLDRLEEEQPAAVEQPDAVGERLRLGHVVRAEEDRRVVLARAPCG